MITGYGRIVLCLDYKIAGFKDVILLIVYSICIINGNLQINMKINTIMKLQKVN